MTFQDDVDALVELLQHSLDGNEFGSSISKVSSQAASQPYSELDAGMKKLIPLIPNLNYFYGTYLGICCGALVEAGADPNLLFPPIYELTKSVINHCLEFADLGLEAGVFHTENFNEALQEFSDNLADNLDRPELKFAWLALSKLHLVVVTVLARLKTARKTMSSNSALVAGVKKLTKFHPGADWLEKIFDVLDDENLIVIHPDQHRGYRVRISGVGDNQQLNLLLADLLIGAPEDGLLEGTRPEPIIVEAMMNKCDSRYLRGHDLLQLANWECLQPDGTLPGFLQSPKGPLETEWIWNEGIPADIHKFQGTRVVLLTEPTVKKGWEAECLFMGMIPEVELVEIMHEDIVTQWINKILSEISS